MHFHLVYFAACPTVVLEVVNVCVLSGCYSRTALLDSGSLQRCIKIGAYCGLLPKHSAAA